MTEDETTHKAFRLPEKLLKACEDDLKQRGVKDFTQYTREALEHFLKCHDAEPSQAMKLIILKFDGKCLKCGGKVTSGSYALWSRGVGVVCLDCHIQRVGDKTSVAKYLRNRELDKVANALKRECDLLAEKVEVFRTVDKLEGLIEGRKRSEELIDKYLKSGLATPEEEELLMKFKEQGLEIAKLGEEVRRFIERYLKTSKWKKRKEEQEEYQR